MGRDRRNANAKMETGPSTDDRLGDRQLKDFLGEYERLCLYYRCQICYLELPHEVRPIVKPMREEVELGRMLKRLWWNTRETRENDE